MNIATYNWETGQITPLNLGQVTVFVTIKLDELTEIIKQFIVEVIDNNIYIEADDVYQATSNDIFHISFEIRDDTKENGLTTSQIVEAIEISTNSLVELIEEDFQRVLIDIGDKTGTTLIKLIYNKDPNITKIIEININ